VIDGVKIGADLLRSALRRRPVVGLRRTVFVSNRANALRRGELIDQRVIRGTTLLQRSDKREDARQRRRLPLLVRHDVEQGSEAERKVVENQSLRGHVAATVV